MLFVSGCVSLPSNSQGVPQQNQTPAKTCRTVIDEVPETKEQCSNVTLTEQSCGVRTLNYSVTRLPKVDLCISEGGCLGKPLGECPYCVKVMSRCILRIQSLEEQKTGTWSVGANYSLGNSSFLKNPITLTIGPNQTADFDFNQIYTVGYPINSASCTLAVAYEPTVDECVQVTRTKTECKNVTSTARTQREVCD